jgi:hypothetical protein
MASARVGFGQVIVPLLGRELARDDRGSGAVSVFEDLEQAPTFAVGERGDGEVVEHEHVVCGHLKLTHLSHQKLTHLAAIAGGEGRSATTA